MRWNTSSALSLAFCLWLSSTCLSSSLGVGAESSQECSDPALEWWARRMKDSYGDHMHVSREGAKAIAKHEGLRLQSYQDTGGVWTIGYGHTGKLLDGRTVGPGQTITKDEALALFAQGLSGAETRVNITAARVGIKLNQHEFDALVSFTFNTGGKWMDPGYIMGKALKSKDRHSIGNAFLIYNKDNDPKDPTKMVEVRGLTSRRSEERDMFLKGVYPA
jgi:lysozyme